MKTWKLLLLALVPGLWGWLCNWLTAVSLNGPAFLFTLAFYIQVPAAIVFCLWLGHLCGRSERSYPACRLVIPFSNHSWGPPETLAANALSLLMLAVLFSLGFLWGRRRR